MGFENFFWWRWWESNPLSFFNYSMAYTTACAAFPSVPIPLFLYSLYYT